MPGHVSVVTVTLEETDDQTLKTQRTVFETVEDRDGMLATGAEEGGIESMDRIAELLASTLTGDPSCDVLGCGSTT
jgi:uncharacterized protein YndB with AHSA1/START domain